MYGLADMAKLGFAFLLLVPEPSFPDSILQPLGPEPGMEPQGHEALVMKEASRSHRI